MPREFPLGPIIPRQIRSAIAPLVIRQDIPKDVRHVLYEAMGHLKTSAADLQKAVDLLATSYDAWEDEEDSVKEEHEDLIKGLKVFLEARK